MFESLSDKLKQTLKNLRGQGKLTPEHVDVALREIRMALLEADVNYKVAKDFVEAVRVKAEGQEVWQDLKPHEQVVKIVYDELAELMGGTSSRLVFTKAIPNVRPPHFLAEWGPQWNRGVFHRQPLMRYPSTSRMKGR